MRSLKIAFRIIAVLAILAGVIWIFQGLNVLPGSLMTRDVDWTDRGAALTVAGALLLWGASRNPRPKPQGRSTFGSRKNIRPRAERVSRCVVDPATPNAPHRASI